MMIALVIAGALMGLLAAYVIIDFVQEVQKRRRRREAYNLLGKMWINNFVVGVESILNDRLDEQRKAQLRHIKERDAADHEVFDKVKEYRHDFDGPDETG